MDVVSIRDITTDALGYWERRRPLYNIVLATVVIGYFVAGLPQTMSAISLDGALDLLPSRCSPTLCTARLGGIITRAIVTSALHR